MARRNSRKWGTGFLLVGLAMIVLALAERAGVTQFFVPLIPFLILGAALIAVGISMLRRR